MDTILTIRKKNISMSQVATGVQIEEWGLVHIGDAATVHVGVATVRASRWSTDQ